MAKKSSKKVLKSSNAQIILFVLVMIIMRMVVLNFMSEVSGIDLDELSRARIYNGDITALLFLESLVNFFGNFLLETYKGITLLAVINVFFASYILTKKDFTGNFYFNMLIAYLFSSIVTVLLLLTGIVLFFCIMQCMVIVGSLKIDASSEILWLIISSIVGIILIKYFKKSVVFSLLAFLIISAYASSYSSLGKRAIDIKNTQYSLEEFVNNLNLSGK